MGTAWDKELSKEMRALSIENMRRLGLVISDMCYIALRAYSEKRSKPLTQAEIFRVMDNELNLIVDENIEEESWREMIFNMALKKFERHKKHAQK